jgi:sulfur relay (sulfurtransferase) DsrF/TusC family protein
MARRVVSVLRSGPRALRTGEPALEANAYAVAEDVDLTLVLRGAGVELALAGAELPPEELAGVALPPVAAAHDLRAIVESGVAVYADAEDLARRGLDPSELVAGVRVIDSTAAASVLRDADAVIAW